ncbi:hypothetical protein SD51_07470 [Alicyclobacillus tengchongensis]|nr:hypothetical protein SD51_07470 [Alicyclobacillus tengchongensis]
MERSYRDAIYAGSLLGYAKAAVRNTSAAITETATPAVRQVLNRHLQQAIELHEQIFNYMLQHDLYPAYDVEKIIEHDIRNAKSAIAMPIRSRQP